MSIREQKQKIRFSAGLLLVIAVGLAVYFAFFAAKAPEEIPDLPEYTGSVTVTHGNALLDARMTGEDATGLVEILCRGRFSPSQEASLHSFASGIRMVLDDGREIDLLREEDKVFARAVGSGGEEGFYTVSSEVYEQVRLQIYTVFPDGVTFTDLQEWWDTYFYIASLTLMDTDFNSAQEIAPEAVAQYTLYQMAADGSAEEYRQTGANGSSWYQIPYAQFLTRAQTYFADGANISLKETRFYREEDRTMLFAVPADSLGLSDPPAADQPEENGGYKLVSVHRDLMGVLTAEIQDYNEVGFTEGGVHTQTHYFTLVCGSDGRYRFVSKRSQVIDPAQVSVEGYFLNIGRIGEITPEQEAEQELTQAGILDGNMLLGEIRRGASGYQMLLYGVNPRTGGVMCTAQIPEEASAAALERAEVTADGTGVLVFAQDRVIALDSRLNQTGETALPEELTGEDYDCTDDRTAFCWVDDTGLWLKRGDEEAVLLAAHPVQPQGEAEIRLTRPRFILDGQAVLAAEVQDGQTLYYTRYDLDGLDEALEKREKEEEKKDREETSGEEEPTGLLEGRRVGIYPGTVLSESCTDAYLVVLYPNQESAQMSGYMAGTVHYFEDDATFSFILPDNEEAGPMLILDDRIYYFEQISQPGTEDIVFELKVLELGSSMNRISTGLKVSNAQPRILGADADGRVLFSFISPSGSGMGITNPTR